MTDKDETIVNLLRKVRSNPNFDIVEIVDYWDGDLCATGLKKDDRLVYVSTYDFCKKSPLDGSRVEYDCDFEILNKKDFTTFQVVKEVKTKDEEYLFKEIGSFLNVECFQESV